MYVAELKTSAILVLRRTFKQVVRSWWEVEVKLRILGEFLVFWLCLLSRLFRTDLREVFSFWIYVFKIPFKYSRLNYLYVYLSASSPCRFVVEILCFKKKWIIIICCVHFSIQFMQLAINNPCIHFQNISLINVRFTARLLNYFKFKSVFPLDLWPPE